MTLDALDMTPSALRLAWWLTSWLRGEVVTDLLVDAVIGDDATHTFSTAAIGGPESAETLVAGLGRLRAEGASMAGVAYPADGDPVGLGGPSPFNAAALDAGEAVVTDAGVGLVPARVGAVVTWTVLPADRRQLSDVGEADRGLRQALVESAATLGELDVARWRPEAADAILNLRHRRALRGAPGTPPRCVDLAARGIQARDIVALALEDDGAAVSATEMAARRAALVPLDRAARRALTAAGSPEVWPS